MAFIKHYSALKTQIANGVVPCPHIISTISFFQRATGKIVRHPDVADV